MFAPFPTINSVLSNATELRLQSHHVVGVPVENGPPMTRRDGASELPNLNEVCEPNHGGTPRTPQDRGPSVAEINNGSPTEIQRFPSNAAELRLQSHHLVGFPMENRPKMTRRGGAYELPNLNEGCETSQGGMPRTP
jgi:hypothetical protein